MASFCAFCGKKNPDGAVYCGGCGKQLKITDPISGERVTKQLGMKWYKFIVYFQLPISIVSLMMYAYKGYKIKMESYNRESYYIIALLYLAVIIYGIFVMIQLLRLKRGATMKYYLFIILSNCVWILELIINIHFDASMMVEVDDSYLSKNLLFWVIYILLCVVSMAIYIILNYLYFRKREHLFVN